MTETGQTDEDVLRRRRGDAVRRRRNELGMSQTALAEAAGITQQNLSQMEKGQHDGSVPTWQKLARALGVKVDDLFDPTEAAAS